MAESVDCICEVLSDAPMNPTIHKLFCDMRQDISSLEEKLGKFSKDLMSKPSWEEISYIKDKVDKFTPHQNVFDSMIQSSIERIKKDVNDYVNASKKVLERQMEDNILNVNDILRAHNVLIEKKVFEMTKPTLEFSEIKRATELLKEHNDKVFQMLNQQNMFIEEFTSQKIRENSRPTKNLNTILENFAEKDRISKLEVEFAKDRATLNTLEKSFVKLSDITQAELPSYIHADPHLFTEKPKIPKLMQPKSIMEYFTYMMTVFPIIQEILRSFWTEINCIRDLVSNEGNIESSIPSTTNEKDFDGSVLSNYVKREELDDIRNTLKQIKSSTASIDDFKNISERVQRLRESFVDREEFDMTLDSLTANIAKIEQSFKRETLQAKQQSDRPVDFSDTPAKTVVRSKGTTAHKIVFPDEVKRPSTAASYSVKSAQMKFPYQTKSHLHLNI